MFDKEQWVVIADDKEHQYADAVSNAVEVVPERGRSYKVFIRVPSGLFTYFKDVMRITPEDMQDDPVSFFLQEDNGIWFFGIWRKHDGTDLWKYRSLPAWAQFRK